MTMQQQRLLSLLILTGVCPLVLTTHRKFYLIQQGATWYDAQTYCRVNHDDLVTIQGPEDMMKVQAVAQKQQFYSYAWIGLFKVFHDWRWSLGNESLGTLTPEPWCPAQPDNWARLEECGFTSSTCWADTTCTSLGFFICYDDNNTGSDRYIYYWYGKQWYEAQAYCRLYHTDLAIARDAAEVRTVHEKALYWSWIGLSRNSWTWSDQTYTPVIMWAPGFPGTLGENAYCGYMINGKIYDDWCVHTRPFYCQSVVTGQQQLIRMKVQSDQNVNAPELMTLILQKIVQRLEEHGVENVVVKWRQQPNGNFFN